MEYSRLGKAVLIRQKFLKLSDDELLSKSNLSNERLNAILHGKEPTNNEVMNLSLALLVEPTYLISVSTNTENVSNLVTTSLIKKYVENNDIDTILKLYIGNKFVKDFENIYLTYSDSKTIKKLDDEISQGLIELLYNNDYIVIARQLSTSKFYIKEKYNLNDTRLNNYLFGDCADGENFLILHWFSKYFNSLLEDDKKSLFDIICKRVDYIKEICEKHNKDEICFDGKSLNYIANEEEIDRLTNSFAVNKKKALVGIVIPQIDNLDLDSSYKQNYIDSIKFFEVYKGDIRTLADKLDN